MQQVVDAYRWLLPRARARGAVVVSRLGSDRGQVAAFIANRPSAYALRDLKTGLVLFAGRLADPRPQK